MKEYGIKEYDNKKYDIGIDLGGTNIACGIVDEHGKLLHKDSVPADLPRSPEEIVDSIYEVVSRVLRKKGIRLGECRSIGAGIPGTVDSDRGIVEYANNLEFYNVPFVNMLRDKFRMDVYGENDAVAASIGEYMYGAGKGTGSMVMLTLGTGVGGGIIMDGRCWHGINGAAGEIGHMVIHTGGRQCTCGRRGCLEAYASATALVQKTEEMLREQEKTFGRKMPGCGEMKAVSALYEQLSRGQKLDGKKIMEAVKSGDEIAKLSYGSFLSDLSEGIANIINIFQPECLVIGGGLSGIGEELLLKPVKEQVATMIYSRYSERKTDIRLAELGNDAGIIGASKIRAMR
ncbi:MAG: ROK family protein [Lachnospiraceae bacterium]|nr:ROK family protein [Lachnospiraceae bacterium]